LERKFALDIVIGATNVATISNLYELSSGEVSIKDFKIKTGSINSDNYTDGVDDLGYKKFTLLSSSADATVALYAGSISNYSESSSTESYDIEVAYGNVGEIATQPTNPKGYVGVTTDSMYLTNNDNASSTINSRTDCGVINTKYLPYASNTEIGDQLTNLYSTEEPLQLLMIYNQTEGNYGYIGNSNTISANDYAKISVTLRVTGDAKAYIYIIDTASETKSIMQFTNLTINNDIVKGLNGTTFNGSEKQLYFVVDKNTKSTDGFVTVNAYIATGKTSKDFRVEIWNGSRDGVDKSQGYVFVKTIDVTSSSAFDEPSTWNESFATSGNPLFDQTRSEISELIPYTRPLTSTEKEFNKDYPDQAVSYDASYVWAKGTNFIYAIFNTLDVEEVDPYDSIVEEEKEGCAKETDPSTFWLSFSSILLGVVLVLALIALAVKVLRRKRIANRNDAKTQYEVKSRISTHKANQKIKESKKVVEVEEPAEETQE